MNDFTIVGIQGTIIEPFTNDVIVLVFALVGVLHRGRGLRLRKGVEDISGEGGERVLHVATHCVDDLLAFRWQENGLFSGRLLEIVDQTDCQ